MGNCPACIHYKRETGECRRYAPSPMGYRQFAHWPKVKETDGCGDFAAADMNARPEENSKIAITLAAE